MLSKANENARRAKKRNLKEEIREAQMDVARAQLRVTVAENGLRKANERLSQVMALQGDS